MKAVRLLAVLVAVLALAPAAAARTDAPRVAAPQGLRAFLLRADEPKSDVYSRTPSFAWKPVPRALRYEFQLSTSSRFRDSGIVYADRQVKAPAIAVPVALPWVTGKPYALYARVRAITQTGTTAWTRELGFNMRWPTLPEPMSSFPGLLRWTPVAGATAYQVWLLDARKVVDTTTNVADEREHYTFHQAAQWTSTVRWRVRPVRQLYGTRTNLLPAVSYGPWSPVYTAVNPPFATGALGVVATVSDTVTDTTELGDAHRLMPGFAFAGSTSSVGDQEELYRVYAFTDSDCVNVVFRGSVVGSPAFAPRATGMLRLPRSLSEIAAARNKYLRDLGDEEPVKETTVDGALLTPNEDEKPAADSDDAAAGDDDPPAEETPATGTQSAALTTEKIPPVDLWDTDWPRSGYYWTVVGVEAVTPDPVETTLASGAAVGATKLVLDSATGLAAGDKLEVGLAPPEVVTIESIDGDTVTLSAPLTGLHYANEEVRLSAETILYQDVELPQDACAAGRVHRFGKLSEPAVAVAGAPLASGLSTNGKLVSASRSQAVFYGSPVVAWNPAAGAHAYEVQWSRTSEPFKAAAKPLLTYSTSAVLSLSPGVWYYRVRGLNLAMPAGARALGWSDPVRIVVAKPRFTVVKK